MTASSMTNIIRLIDEVTYVDENQILDGLIKQVELTDDDRKQICDHAAKLVTQIREQAKQGLMEVFLSEYGLSTDEGVSLMCLAEALLRVPDAETIDALIEDKIASSHWAKHLGQSTSPLVNASTWALMLTGKVLQDQLPGPVGHLRAVVKRLGEPFIRKAVNQAMKEMGRQFVLGENIQSALSRAKDMEKQGYTYSYDMLGEAALTNADAEFYLLSYSHAISEIAKACKDRNVQTNPSISVKLSALFPRYEVAKRNRVMAELVPRIKSLAILAKSAGMGLTIDAEEADRLNLSLEVIEQLMSEPALTGWDGFGVVVQAYGQRAGPVIDTLYLLAKKFDLRITVRLVKGAYWDSEIKRAQLKGIDGFPVFTSKAATDVSYIANAKRLLGMTDRLFPQFATHNAHTIAAILHMATDKNKFEFQRLHGMGEQLHLLIKEQENTQCRIYAPVGAHQDLLAYLVRRLLENGANSSFVNQVVDKDVPAKDVTADPFHQILDKSNMPFLSGKNIFQPERNNAKGWDLSHWPTLIEIDNARNPFYKKHWHAHSLIDGENPNLSETLKLYNPSLTDELIGSVNFASKINVKSAVFAAKTWNDCSEQRAKVLNKVANLYESNFGELLALLIKEAGKTLADAISELREAVDFLRYYAANGTDDTPVGIFVCISPWNFPLAIFTGQIAAALAAGNAVLAKPAEQTTLIAWRAVQLMHEAGVPHSAIQLLLGDGSIGALLTQNPQVGGVVFTGSTETARLIRRSMATHLPPGAPLIAETGGLNAMIVDSTALPEQAVAAVIESAFQSAGQRCSALRCLYVQEDIVETFKKMLFGAMDELQLGDPWQLSTDSGPVIDHQALNIIKSHVEKAEVENRILKTIEHSNSGTFFGPTVIAINGIEDLDIEIFGPVLHLATFKADQINHVINNINNTGYGLTFGLQTRIDDRVEALCKNINAGNIYINRNQIGAIVGSQPFGGNGLSGTGPKAGGPHYLMRFYKHLAPNIEESESEDSKSNELGTASELKQLIDKADKNNILIKEGLNLPGVTGESNHWSLIAREPVLCLGPGKQAAAKQAKIIKELGGKAVEFGVTLAKNELNEIEGYSSVIWWGGKNKARILDKLLAEKQGPLIPLITAIPDIAYAVKERHVCVDTTASGGNAELLSHPFL